MSIDAKGNSAAKSGGNSHAGSGHGHGRGHSHGLIDRSITRSRDGLRAVGISLGVLLVTAILQGVIFISMSRTGFHGDRVTWFLG